MSYKNKCHEKPVALHTHNPYRSAPIQALGCQRNL